MVTSGYQFMNLPFVHLSKNMATEHQLFGKGSGIQKITQKAVEVSPLD